MEKSFITDRMGRIDKRTVNIHTNHNKDLNFNAFVQDMHFIYLHTFFLPSFLTRSNST